MEKENTPFLFVVCDSKMDDDEEDNTFYYDIYEVLEEMYAEELEKELKKNIKDKRNKAYEEAMKGI